MENLVLVGIKVYQLNDKDYALAKLIEMSVYVELKTIFAKIVENNYEPICEQDIVTLG